MQALIKINFFKLDNGKVPFLDWLESLDTEIQLRIRNRITRIELGNFGDTKLLGKGVYELRFHFNSGFRVYFGKKEKQIIIILTGGNKNSQKKDIIKAQKYWDYYLKGGNYDEK